MGCQRRLFAALLLLTLVTPGRSQPGKQVTDPLPPGALVRLGTPLASPREQAVTALVFFPDSRTIAALQEGVIHLWDVASGKEVQRWGEARGRGRLGLSDSIAISPDGKTLASGSAWDQGICLWVVATGKERTVLPASQNNVVAFAPDGKRLVSSSVCFCYGRCGDFMGGDNTLRFWDVATRQALVEIQNIGSGSLAFSPDGKLLATARQQGPLELWQVHTGRLRLRFGPERGGTWALAFSPDGKLLATATWENNIHLGTLRVWEVASGQEWCRFPKNLDHGAPLAFTPDGHRVITQAAGEKSPCCWDAVTGLEARPLVGVLDQAGALTFSPDGKLLATAHKDGSILLWDAARLLPASRPPPVRLSPAELEARWADLAGPAGSKAQAAVRALVAAHGQAAPFLHARLKPVPPVNPERLRQLLADLDSEQFSVRRRATAELERLEERAEPNLREALDRRPSLEVRCRLEQLLDRIDGKEWLPPAEELRALRSVLVLETIDTLAARQVLAALATGAPGAPLTREALLALGRLGKHGSP